MKFKSLLLFAFCSALLTSAAAQSSKSVKGDAAFLFAYYPKEGKHDLFDKGYKQHLKWHREHDDPLPWYGWHVASGERIGMFIDGTFGISFEAFDNRIQPAKDGANFKQTTAPYADAVWRKVFRLKPELSTSTRLEHWNPSPNIEVYTFSVAPGKESVFRNVVSKLISTLKSNELRQEFTFYQQLSGGNLPTYLLMVPRKSFSYFTTNSAFTTLGHVIKRSFKETRAKDLLNKLSESVLQIHSETWRYREDLSYFPEND